MVWNLFSLYSLIVINGNSCPFVLVAFSTKTVNADLGGWFFSIDFLCGCAILRMISSLRVSRACQSFLGFFVFSRVFLSLSASFFLSSLKVTFALELRLWGSRLLLLVRSRFVLLCRLLLWYGVLFP